MIELAGAPSFHAQHKLPAPATNSEVFHSPADLTGLEVIVEYRSKPMGPAQARFLPNP